MQTAHHHLHLPHWSKPAAADWLRLAAIVLVAIGALMALIALVLLSSNPDALPPMMT